MDVPPPHPRLGASPPSLALAASLLLPAAPGQRRRGGEPLDPAGRHDQKLDAEPVAFDLLADYEMFQVQYELLVGFDPNLDPAPGFADTWERPRRPHDLSTSARA